MSKQINYGGIITLVVNSLAFLVSWYYNHSIIWGIFHFVFGWIYLLYSLVIGRFADGNFQTIMDTYF